MPLPPLQSKDFLLLLPEIILAMTAVGTLIVAGGRSPQREQGLAQTFALLGSFLAGVAVIYLYPQVQPHQPAEWGLVGKAVAVDGLSLFFKLASIFATILVILASYGYAKPLANPAEFFSLLVFAELAMCFLASGAELITIYISLEFLSLVSYIMAGYRKEDPKSNEAAVKYFLYGSVSAAAMAYGLTILYGMTGTTFLEGVVSQVQTTQSPLLVFSFCLVAVGFLFKVAVAPFHQWAPDIYEGSPTPVATFLAAAPKAAGFAVLLRAFLLALPARVYDWGFMMGVVAALSMTLGNLSAIAQTSMKRMLAYSSIAQAGYILMGVAASAGAVRSAEGLANAPAIPATMIYMLVYLIMNIGAFAVVIAVERLTGTDRIPDYAGLIYRSPWLAWSMVVFLLSLAGVPPTAGFVGKWYLFAAVLHPYANLVWLAIVAGVNTVISVYYYFNVVRTMFFLPPETETLDHPPLGLTLVVLVSLVLTIGILVQPQRVIQLAEASSHILFLE